MTATTVSCAAGYGAGGLGQHLAQIVEELRSSGELQSYYSSAPKPGDIAGVAVDLPLTRYAMRYTPARFDSGWRTFIGSELFDRAVAKRVVRADRYVGFSGQALHTFRSSPASMLELVSPTAHVELLAKRYQAAHRAHPVEHPWLNKAGIRKALAEYERADVIRVASDYVWDSFVECGVSEGNLVRDELVVAARFARREPPEQGDVFRIVYVGALTVTKGVPVLLDAFSRLSGDAELVLVGGWASRGMRRFIGERMSADPRIRVVPGDPLDHLRQADVLVHPTYGDGLGFAPMEAVACGVPVIVTEDTGMKEHVADGVDGLVVPTGDVDAIVSGLEQVRQGRLKTAVTTESTSRG